jgi:alpha-galactosidase
MVTGLAGRVYQSGLLDRMTPQQKALVADGLRVHKETRTTIANSIPRFPTGLPTWADPWVTVAFAHSDATFVLAWRQAWAPDSLDIPLPWTPESSTVEQIYPDPALFTSWQADVRENTLHITTKDPQPAARIWKLRVNQ